MRMISFRSFFFWGGGVNSKAVEKTFNSPRLDPEVLQFPACKCK